MCWYDCFILLLSETTRKQFSLALMMMQMVSMVMGVFMVMGGCHLMGAYPELEGVLTGYVYEVFPGFMVFSGLCVVVLNIVAFKFLLALLDWRVLHRNTAFYGSYPCLLVQIRFILLLFIIFGTVWACVSVESLHEVLQEGFEEAVDLYHINPLKRWSVNSIQFRFKCCGSQSWKDWFTVHWVMAKHVFQDVHSPQALLTMDRGMVLTAQVPYSCCDTCTARECIYKDVTNESLHYRYLYDAEVTLYKRGCVEALEKSVGWVWKWCCETFMRVFILYEAILLLLLRYTQTSTRTAMKYQDVTLTAQGYLCYWGPSLVPSGFKHDVEERVQRKMLMDQLANEDENLHPNTSQYELSEADKHWLEKEELLEKFLGASLISHITTSHTTTSHTTTSSHIPHTTKSHTPKTPSSSEKSQKDETTDSS